MAKLKIKLTDLQEEIMLAWAAKQDTTPEEVLGRVITAFATDMGIDTTEPEADQHPPHAPPSRPDPSPFPSSPSASRR